MEVAQENEKQFDGCPMKYDGAYANNGKSACKCAEEHRQLAEWLKELKALKEQESIIDKIRVEIMDFEEELFHRPNTDYADYAAVRHCVEIIDKYTAERSGEG